MIIVDKYIQNEIKCHVIIQAHKTKLIFNEFI